MKTRMVKRLHLPFPQYQPLFRDCVESPGCNARLAWAWAAVSAAVETGKTSVRTSYSRLAELADGNRKTVAEQLRRLQEAGVAVLDEVKKYTSFRLRLRIGPDGPFYEGGKDYRRGNLRFFRAPHFLIGRFPQLTPEAKVIWCWACSLPKPGAEEEPKRPSGFRTPFDLSYHKERKAIEQLLTEGFMALTRKRNSMHSYCPSNPTSIDEAGRELHTAHVRVGDDAAGAETR